MTLERRKMNSLVFLFLFFFFQRKEKNHEDVVEKFFYEGIKFIMKYLGNEMEVRLGSLELIFLKQHQQKKDEGEKLEWV